MNKSKFKDLAMNFKANDSIKFDHNKHYIHGFNVCQVQSISMAIEADNEIYRLNQALINIHDRLLRGDSDVELLEMLSSALTKNND